MNIEQIIAYIKNAITTFVNNQSDFVKFDFTNGMILTPLNIVCILAVALLVFRWIL